MSNIAVRVGITIIIFSGFSTVAYKFQNTQYVYEGPYYKYFFHPYMQTFLMFISQFLCLPTFYLWKSINKEKFQEEQKEAREKGKIIGMNKFYLIAPAMLDLLSSTMLLISLNFIPTSAYQMLRGGSIISTFIFTLILVNKKIKKQQIIGTISVVIGILFVGGANVFSSSQSESKGVLQILGFILLIASLLINGLFFIVEQKLLEKYHLSPMQVVGFEGLFGLLSYSVVIAIICQIPCPFDPSACVFTADGRGYLEGWNQFWSQTFNNKLILFTTIYLFISSMAYNVAGVTITKYINALARNITDISKIILVWVISIIVTIGLGSTQPNHHWEVLDQPLVIVLQIIGFIFLVLGNLVYNGLIKLPARKKSQKQSDETREQLITNE